MFTFGKHQRLLDAADFRAVFNDAQFRASHKHLLILANFGCNKVKTNGRLGLVVAKKNVRLAVERNRIKRLIRESFRLQQQHLKGINAIVLARRDLDQQSNQQIFEAINEQWLIIRKKAEYAAARSY